jgi:hypothetical protein
LFFALQGLHSCSQILGRSSLRMIQQVYSHLTPGGAYDALMRLLVDQG